MIQYFVSSKNPLSKFMEVKMVIDDIQNLKYKNNKIYLKIPAWRPGRYELQNFASNIQKVYALNSNNSWSKLVKTDRNTWEINLENYEAKNLTIIYYYYANNPDAGGSFVSEEEFYINPINCLLYIDDNLEISCELYLGVLDNWKVGSGLNINKSKDGQYPFCLTAQTYHKLGDSPIIAGENLIHHQFEITEYDFPVHLWFSGIQNIDLEFLEKEFTYFIRSQIKIFKTIPVSDYHFIFKIVNHQFYHGVEHQNSTVIVLGPEFNISQNSYQNLLGVSSHEFFHLWNIKAIRPKELQPYDYSKEVYFKTGYIAEGVTTYYGDLQLLRTGSYTEEVYFDLLGKDINSHLQNFGYWSESISESSIDLWVDGYRRGIPDDKNSIYREGGLMAWILDIEMRRVTNNKISLDTFMRKLYASKKILTRGYSDNDLFELITKLTNMEISELYKDMVLKPTKLLYNINQTLDYLGLQLQLDTNLEKYESKYGFKLIEVGSDVRIFKIAPDSPAKANLCLDDRLIAVNGTEITVKNYKKAFEYYADSDLKIHLFRNNEIKEITLNSEVDQLFFEKYKMSKLENPSKEQQKNYKKWAEG